MVTLKDAYENVKVRLKKCEIENYKVEAVELIKKSTGMNLNDIYIYGDREIDHKSLQSINYDLARRENGEPLQYILGMWEFYSLPFEVGEGVLIPRQDTETLVECSLQILKDVKNPVILDLCSGSGCIAVSLDKNLDNADITAFELSHKAFYYLKKNIRNNKSSVKPVMTDVLSCDLSEYNEKFDLIVSNPPYLNDEAMKTLQKEVTFEPKMALYAENNGMLFYEVITERYKSALKKGGTMAFEIGINQQDDIIKIFIKNGFENICVRSDLCGIIRVVFADKN